MSRYSKEEVIVAISKFVNDNGKLPTKHDCRNLSYLPSAQTIRRLTERNELTDILEVWQKSNFVEPDKRFCKECNKDISRSHPNNIFCDRSCSAKWNNRNKPKRIRFRDASEEIHCLHCGLELTLESQKKFCSQECSSKHRSAQHMDDWLKGGALSINNNTIRNFLGIIEGEKCSVCGITEWNGKPIVLEVEHKDGNSDDSSKENVCLICPNCHSQTSTYKGKNKGNGRHYRRTRYAEGKSY